MELFVFRVFLCRLSSISVFSVTVKMDKREGVEGANSCSFVEVCWQVYWVSKRDCQPFLSGFAQWAVMR